MLALASAALFGSMTVALRFALAREPDAEAGALLTIAAALLVTLPFVAAGEIDLAGIWPFLLAGVLGPGCSQLLFTLAVRDAGPSRTSVTVGTAPLFSVAIALVLLNEPAKAGVIAGAILIVTGGILLVREPGRPEHVKWIGLGYALAATIIFAVRDNLVRHLSLDTGVEPALAAACDALRRRRHRRRLAARLAAAAPDDGLPRLRPCRESSSASPTSASSRPTTAAASRSSRRSSRRSRSGASRSRRCCCAGTSSSARASSAGAALVVVGGVLIGVFR